MAREAPDRSAHRIGVGGTPGQLPGGLEVQGVGVEDRRSTPATDKGGWLSAPAARKIESRNQPARAGNASVANHQHPTERMAAGMIHRTHR